MGEFSKVITPATAAEISLGYTTLPAKQTSDESSTETVIKDTSTKRRYAGRTLAEAEKALKDDRAERDRWRGILGFASQSGLDAFLSD